MCIVFWWLWERCNSKRSCTYKKQNPVIGWAALSSGFALFITYVVWWYFWWTDPNKFAAALGFTALGGLAAVLVSYSPVHEAWRLGGVGMITSLVLLIITKFPKPKCFFFF